MSREPHRTLFAIALAQGGYFTAKQAKQIGYDYPHLDYHIAAGNFVRVNHGLYRFAGLPPSEHDDFVHLSLWSRNRADEPKAVVSHQTALALHDLGEVLPTKIHLTVPPGFRKKPPRGCVLHAARLSPTDIEEREGFREPWCPSTWIATASRESGSREKLLNQVGAVRQLLRIAGGHRKAHARARPIRRSTVTLDFLWALRTDKLAGTRR